MTSLRRGPASRHPLYGTWNGIRQRCLNPKSGNYENWGGRGIRMHEPWREDFWAFAEYVATLPGHGEPGRTIDRYPDVNGDYAPGNLRWATAFEQMQNTRAQLDPMNGIQRDHGKTTWYYQITRDGELYAEYGFASPEDAAASRDHVQAMINAGAGKDALAYIQRRKDERQEAWRLAREDAEKKAAEARRLRDEAREAKRLARELGQQTRRRARQERKMTRAQRWHEMNTGGMSLSEIARQEGVSTAHVSLMVKDAGLQVVVHNSTGYPGVKAITRNGRTYYVARITRDGKRVQLGQRKTPEEAYELIVSAKGEQPQAPEAVRPRKRRTVEVRAA